MLKLKLSKRKIKKDKLYTNYKLSEQLHLNRSIFVTVMLITFKIHSNILYAQLHFR